MPARLTRGAFLKGAAAMACALAAAGTGAQEREAMMDQRIIPSSGEKIPVIGCGTWQGFDVGASEEERAQYLGELLAAVGARDKAFLATKVWTSGRQAGIDQMKRSLALFRTDHVELMQVHNLLDWRTHLATLRQWQQQLRPAGGEAKAVRYVGVTHYTASAYAQLEAVMREARLDFVQVNYAADDRTAEQRILPLARERGIAVLVNLPFGGGGLLRRLSGRKLPPWAVQFGCTSWAQLLLKFVLGHDAVTCVIPGTSKPEHMRDNATAGSPPFPDAAMRERIAAEIEG